MPYLYCEKHGREREVSIIERQDVYRQEDEIMLVATGTLVSGPWLCDSCNAPLNKGNTASLVSAFPSHCRDGLYDYDFGYELAYFAMNTSDKAASYGADWPDDSIRHRRSINRKKPPQRNQPLCAMDFLSKK